MKKINLLFLVILLCSSCNKNRLIRVEWETRVSYNMISSGGDTLYIEAIDTLESELSWKPVIIADPDSTSLVINFMSPYTGKFPDPAYSRDYDWGGRRKNMVIYRSLPKQKIKFQLLSFTKRQLRTKKVSAWDGKEIQ